MSIETPQVFTLPYKDGRWSIAVGQATQILQWHLPTAIPLYRRLQFGSFTPSAVILTTIDGLGDEGYDLAALDAQQPWLIAVLDRAFRPETEMWICGSWESSRALATDSDRRAWARLAKAFAAKYQTLACPPSIHIDVVPAASAPTDVMTMGAVHQKTVQVFEDANVMEAPGRVRESNATAYSTFIFNLDNIAITRHADAEVGARTLLPQGLRWGHLTPSQMHLVCARSPYPRQAKSLARMPNVGVFEEATDEPIAWGLIGADGSLTSLHVEENWRRQGLAGLMVRKLFTHEMAVFLRADDRLTEPNRAQITQAYVAKGNIGSEKLCRSLSGQVMWDCFYFRTSLREQAHH